MQSRSSGRPVPIHSIVPLIGRGRAYVSMRGRPCFGLDVSHVPFDPATVEAMLLVDLPGKHLTCGMLDSRTLVLELNVLRVRFQPGDRRNA